MQFLDEEYLNRYYKTKGSAGHSFHDLQLECMGDAELSPFESRSVDMRVLTGQTSLFQSVCFSLIWYNHGFVDHMFNFTAMHTSDIR